MRDLQPRGTKRRHPAHSSSIRDIAHPARGEQVVFDYRKVRNGNIEAHAAGAVFSRTMYELARRVGIRRAQTVLYAVIRDSAAWSNGGSWQQAARALAAAPVSSFPGDAQVAAAMAAALRATHLNEAL
jgi:Zn-dependent metalloprotease